MSSKRPRESGSVWQHKHGRWVTAVRIAGRQNVACVPCVIPNDRQIHSSAKPNRTRVSRHCIPAPINAHLLMSSRANVQQNVLFVDQPLSAASQRSSRSSDMREN
jgi:hypothetical protein